MGPRNPLRIVQADGRPMTSASLAREHYERDDIVHIYGSMQDLFPAEKTLLERYQEQITGRRVLDLGCGGGRTAPWLHALAADYVGVDYSGRMIEICRHRYPHMTFQQGDATALKSFDRSSFDFVLFSYNGIDSMSHEQRLMVFAEIFRIVKENGWFAFSSHNVEYANIVKAFDHKAGFTSRGLRRNVKNVISYLRVRRYQVLTAEYAILSDPRAGMRQLSYYISRKNQLAQLQVAGFVDTEVLSWDGRQISVDQPDPASMAFYYICRRPATSPASEAAGAALTGAG